MADESHETPPTADGPPQPAGPFDRPPAPADGAETDALPPIPSLPTAIAATLVVMFFGGAIVMAARSETLAALFLSVVLAELCCCSIWAVFGTGHWATRWLVTLAAETIVLGEAIAGVCWQIPGPGEFPDELLQIACFAPLLLSLMQLPFWIVRWGAGYRFVPRDAPPIADARPRGQFTIRDVLGLTTIVAVVLGCARAGAMLGRMSASETAEGLATAGIAVLAVDVLLGLPCLVAGLIAKHRARGVLFVMLWSQAPTLLVIFVGFIGVVLRDPTFLWQCVPVVFVASLITATPTLVILGGLQVFRGCGYELRR